MMCLVCLMSGLISWLRRVFRGQSVTDLNDMSSEKSNKRQSDLDAQGQGPSTSFQDPQATSMQQQSGSSVMTNEEYISPEYNMKHKKIGRAMVINNKHFQMKEREDTDQDQNVIVNVLKDLGFEGINIYKNRETKETETRMEFENVHEQDLLNYLNDAGNDQLNNYTDMDCFICVIMSFSYQGCIYCPGEENTNKDNEVELNKLMEPLKGDMCRSLLSKPKIFFIQGCPYKEVTTANDEARPPPEVMVKKIPIEADFLMQSCNIPAYKGRKRGQACWYINALCEALKKHCIDEMTNSEQRRSLHLLTVLTRVNQLVLNRFKENDMTPDDKNQIPLVTSLLTKHIYFYPKEQTQNRAVEQGHRLDADS